jgi:hypothetical protein
MIGVIVSDREQAAAAEFFELFKTPWEAYDAERAYEVVITTGFLPEGVQAKLILIYSSKSTKWDSIEAAEWKGNGSGGWVEVHDHRIPVYGPIAIFKRAQDQVAGLVGSPDPAAFRISSDGQQIIRIGYDLFDEVAFLLKDGQPADRALVPTLDLHIAILRRFILEAGIPVLEVPPVPAGFKFISCLTHDIDFLKLRQHKFDHSMWGFLYRATAGSVADVAKGRISLRTFFRNLSAAAKLPLVHLGVCEDFWMPFGKYLEVEDGRPSTFFVIPFKNRAGKGMNGSTSSRRATRYDIDDMAEWPDTLLANGCEVAVHGIEAWNDIEAGKEELNRIRSRTSSGETGVRMHWLYFSAESPEKLERAGFSYDSTCGYNDAVGYRAGTSQVFKPLGVNALLELPLHIQDTALFYSGRMHLRETEAWRLCMEILQNCGRHGGVATVLWHDRSLVPERSWDAFYRRLLKQLDSEGTWFASAKDVVGWFRKRRSVRFREVIRAGTRVTVRLDLSGSPGPACFLRYSFPANSRESAVQIPLADGNEFTFDLKTQKIGLGLSVDRPSRDDLVPAERSQT